MTARRSQDPTAQEHDDGASSAVEHWTPQRREAAIPARQERALPTESSAAEDDVEDVEDDSDAEAAQTGVRAVTRGDGVAGQALGRSTEK